MTMTPIVTIGIYISDLEPKQLRLVVESLEVLIFSYEKDMTDNSKSSHVTDKPRNRQDTL